MAASIYDFTKDPDAVLDYGFDWSLWLSAGESISTSTMIATPGITINSNSFAATSAIVWLSGGTAGNLYQITNRITTSQGRTDDRTIVIRAQNK